jgi:ribosome-associated protein
MRSLNTPAGRAIDTAAIRYSFARSGGPGGQHVNTASTKVTVRIVIAETGLREEDCLRLEARFGAVMQFNESQSRSQFRNRSVVTERALDAIDQALTMTKARRATRATRGSVERRLSDKAVNAKRKAQRRWRGDEA